MANWTSHLHTSVVREGTTCCDTEFLSSKYLLHGLKEKLEQKRCEPVLTTGPVPDIVQLDSITDPIAGAGKNNHNSCREGANM